MPQEIELKLALDPRDVPLLRKSPTLNRIGPGKATRKRIVTTYYDTPSLSLLHNAIALRVRKVGHDHVQSIKIERADGRYPAQSAEIESPIPSDRPDLKQVEDRSVRRLVERAHRNRRRSKLLRKIFTSGAILHWRD